MGPGLGRQRSGAASPSGGAGSGADWAGFALSIVCTAAEGKEGVAEERVWGGVPSPAGWLSGGAAHSPLLQGAPKVKLRCQLNIPAAAALRAGRGLGTGVPSPPSLPGLLRVPRRASGARAWRGQRQRCRRGGCGAASGRPASSDL